MATPYLLSPEPFTWVLGTCCLRVSGLLLLMPPCGWGCWGSNGCLRTTRSCFLLGLSPAIYCLGLIVLGTLFEHPTKRSRATANPGRILHFNCYIHTYIYIHTYTHVCMYMHKPRYPCCDLQKEHIRRWFSLVSKRFGIQELGAPKPCPPYPYTVKIVEAGPVPLDAVCRRK